MIKKLLIIGIIIIGGIILFPQALSSFSESSLVKDAFDNDINALQEKASKKVDNTIQTTSKELGKSIDNTIEQFSETLANGLTSVDTIVTDSIKSIQNVDDEKTFTGQVFAKDDNNVCQISVPEMAEIINGEKDLTHIITTNECEFEVNDPVLIIETLDNEIIGDETTITVKPVSSSQVFETLQLRTSQESDDDVMVQFEDTSGQTISVTVILKNSEKELFNGIFYTSKFETFVNDVSNEPHIIEMIVDHAEHGIITSSVYKPAGEYSTAISGVFTKS